MPLRNGGGGEGTMKKPDDLSIDILLQQPPPKQSLAVGDCVVLQAISARVREIDAHVVSLSRTP